MGNYNIIVGNPEALKTDLTVTPNPSSGIIQLTGQRGQVNLYNLSGQILLSVNELPDSKELDISHLPPGLYIIRLTNETGQYIGKLVLE